MAIHLLASLGACAALGVTASGATLNLTTRGAHGEINGALFFQSNAQHTGAGAYDPFVRLRANGVEQGYNTSAPGGVFQARFGRDLTLGEIPTVTIAGVDYREFVLDINESVSSRGRLLSLDRLSVYTSDTGGATTTNLPSLGELVYDLDTGANNRVTLNSRLRPGSAFSDMLLYVRDSAFDGVGDDDFVYLFSRFGDLHRADGGFEEWGIVPGGSAASATIPSVAGAFALLMGSGLVGARRTRR